jgi:signal peptidase I
MVLMDQSARGFTYDVVSFALIALLIVVPIRWFVAQPFIVRGASMHPTFETGEYLIVDQLSYRFHEPARGDVIIMKYPRDESVYFIKRIIGLPGETVELQGTKVIIRHGAGTDATTLVQDYVPPEENRPEYATYTLGADEYFVMGDNRNESSDSRVWGTLPRKDIVGHALVRLFPPQRIDLFPGYTATP